MIRLQFPLVFLLTLPLLVIQPSCGRAPSSRAVVPVAAEEIVNGGEAGQGGEAGIVDISAARQDAPAEAGPTTAEPMPTAPVATRLDHTMARIPAGSFVPLFLQVGEAAAKVEAFEIDRQQVTRGEFLEFVRANPRWRRSQVKPIFTESRYLADWAGDLDIGDEADADRPVTQVSWFAAKAYCEAQGARLPTVDEWEYVAAASADQRDATRDPAFLQWLLELYTRGAKGPLPQVGTGFRNVYGVTDLHGPIREWVLDYNTVLVSDDSRGVGARDHKLYCAGGAIGATRTDDYAAFLRYTFRAGLNGRSTVDNLGFRCAGGR